MVNQFENRVAAGVARLDDFGNQSLLTPAVAVFALVTMALPVQAQPNNPLAGDGLGQSTAALNQ